MPWRVPEPKHRELKSIETLFKSKVQATLTFALLLWSLTEAIPWPTSLPSLEYLHKSYGPRAVII